MVLDPLTGQEQEPQDLRIAIAHKVQHQLRSASAALLLVALAETSFGMSLQRFLYTSANLPDKEKGNLQKEILDTVFAEGKSLQSSFRVWRLLLQYAAQGKICAKVAHAQPQSAECSSYILPADLAPLYEHLCQEIGWSPDAAQLQRMQSANQAKMEELDGKIKDAEENLGDTEVKEALTVKADYLCRIGAHRLSCRLAPLASCTLS